jgi:MFS family permease
MTDPVPAHEPAAEAAATDGVWSPGRRALTTGLVFTVTLVAFEALAVTTILAVIDDDLHDLTMLGFVFPAYFLGSLFGAIAAGYDADRHGPARPFLVGLALFGLGLLGGGLAPNLVVLVGMRALQGVGGGAIPALAYVAIGRAYPPTLQPRMFAVLSSAWVLPGLIGPAISAAVASAVGWRWVFLGLLPLVVLAAAMTTRALRDLGPPGGEEPVDRRARALVLVLGAAMVLAGAAIRVPVAAVILVVIGAVVGARAYLRLVPPGTARLARGLPGAIGLRGLTTFAFFGTDAYVAYTVDKARDSGLLVGGLALTAATLTWTAGSWITERRVRTLGPARFVRVGMLIITCGIGLMICVAHFDVPVELAIVAWAVAGLGMGLAYSPTSLVTLAQADSGAEGSASASLQVSDQLGVALGTGATGAIVAAGSALGASVGNALAIAFLVSAAVAIFTSVAAVRLPPLVTDADRSQRTTSGLTPEAPP